MVSGLMQLMFSSSTSGNVFNLGSPREMTILELVGTIKALTNSTSPIIFHPLPEDDPRQRRPDIGKIEQAVGWSPKVSLEEGLKRTIAWFAQGR